MFRVFYGGAAGGFEVVGVQPDIFAGNISAGFIHQVHGVYQPDAVDVLDEEHEPVVRARVLAFKRSKQASGRYRLYL